MRTPRVTPPGSVQHIISRFVDRRWELTSDRERGEYLRRFGREMRDSDWTCLAYCLMSNHLHLAMVAGTSPLEDWASKVHSPFGRWLNATHARVGPVFAERPSNYTIAPALVGKTIAYIHNNPVRAGVVASAEQSTWSSHNAYLGTAPAPDWLARAQGMMRSGFKSRREFAAFVTAEVATQSIAVDVGLVRAGLRKRGSVEVGSPAIGEIVEYPIVARAFAVVVPTIEEVVSSAREAMNLGADETVMRYARGRQSAMKRVVVHAARTLGIAISDASAALNISRQRGSRISLSRLATAEQRLVEQVVSEVRKVDKVYTVPRSRRAR